MHGVSRLLIDNVGSHRGESRFEDAFLHLEALLGHHVAVLAVAQGDGDSHLALLLIEVDDHGGLVSALDDDLLAVLAIDDSG